MTIEIVFATQNADKLTEIRKILGNSFAITSLSDIGYFVELEENHDNMEMNALQKARFIYQNYKKNCFADDSGLEIDALNGRPGVNSARYASEDKDMNANIEKILEEMKGVSDRKA